MLRVVSVNLNRRFGNPIIREHLQGWLKAKGAAILVCQEPFATGLRECPPVNSFRLLAHTPLLACWIAEGLPLPTVRHHNDRWQEVVLGGLSVHNVYLSASSSSGRRTALVEFARVLRVAHVSHRTSLMVGDFNLAPSDLDGRFGDQPSTFTRPQEREALQALLTLCDLVDTTASQHGSPSAFTFERLQRGAMVRFRCDLALASRALLPDLAVQYDHSVRADSCGFTDHSAILADIEADCLSLNSKTPRTATSPRVKPALDTSRSRLSSQSLAAASYKTALRRPRSSQVARKLCDQSLLGTFGIRSILDYGCGHGADVAFYRSLGFEADGYDAAAVFGRNVPIRRKYDLVTLVFVVNVLPSYEMRVAVVRAAARAVKPGGLLLVAARSASAVATQAHRRSWARFGDGWVSDYRKGTFQKGLTRRDIAQLIREAGMATQEMPLRLTADVTWGVARRY